MTQDRSTIVDTRNLCPGMRPYVITWDSDGRASFEWVAP